jgi:proline iminopeptidase
METHGAATMSDAAQIRWSMLSESSRRPPVVILHGGPGLPDYLGDVAAMITDLQPVYRYDQRGTGRSPWQGPHTFALHLDDLAELLDAWDAHQAVVIGHSYGAALASRFCLAHPDRVAALLLMCGPFTGDWQTRYRAERDRRMPAAQRDRLQRLQQLPLRTEEQEVELLTLSWYTDHARAEDGWRWAAQDALQRRPVNWDMNTQLGRHDHADPLDDHLAELRACLPACTQILAGTADARPVDALESLAHRLGVPLTRIDQAGHAPWMERPDAVRAHLRRFARAAQGDSASPQHDASPTPSTEDPRSGEQSSRPATGAPGADSEVPR